MVQQTPQTPEAPDFVGPWAAPRISPRWTVDATSVPSPSVVLGPRSPRARPAVPPTGATDVRVSGTTGISIPSVGCPPVPTPSFPQQAYGFGQLDTGSTVRPSTPPPNSGMNFGPLLSPVAPTYTGALSTPLGPSRFYPIGTPELPPRPSPGLGLAPNATNSPSVGLPASSSAVFFSLDWTPHPQPVLPRPVSRASSPPREPSPPLPATPPRLATPQQDSPESTTVASKGKGKEKEELVNPVEDVIDWEEERVLQAQMEEERDVNGGGGDPLMAGGFMRDARVPSLPPSFPVVATTPPTPTPRPSSPVKKSKRRLSPEVVIPIRRSKRVKAPTPPPVTQSPSRVTRSATRAATSQAAHSHSHTSTQPRGTPKKPTLDELQRALKKDGCSPYWVMDKLDACFECRRRDLPCYLPKGWTEGTKCLTCRSGACSFAPNGTREQEVIKHALSLTKSFNHFLKKNPELVAEFARVFYKKLGRLITPIAPPSTIGLRSQYRMRGHINPESFDRLVPSLHRRSTSSIAGSDYQNFDTDINETSSDSSSSNDGGDEPNEAPVVGGPVNNVREDVDREENVDTGHASDTSSGRDVNYEELDESHSSATSDNDNVEVPVSNVDNTTVVEEGEDEIDPLDKGNESDTDFFDQSKNRSKK